jgi:hypothetical protein
VVGNELTIASDSGMVAWLTFGYRLLILRQAGNLEMM